MVVIAREQAHYGPIPDVPVHHELEPTETLLGIGTHNYQPPREIHLVTTDRLLQVVPHVNHTIHDQVYERHLANGERLNDGNVTTAYGTLRSWMKVHKPESFSRMRQTFAQTPDVEYKVMGDPYFHSILPLLPVEDQRMLISIGKQAFMDDLGVEPQGFWFPEGAVSRISLDEVAQAGYRFTMLSDRQVTYPYANPAWVRYLHPQLAAIVYNAGFSDAVANDDWFTMNAHDFLDRLPRNRMIVAMVDGETFGHHYQGKDQFLQWVTNPGLLQHKGVTPMNVKQLLETYQPKPENWSSVYDGTSWSCPHNLGRWTGHEGCNCDNPSEHARSEKVNYYHRIRQTNDLINVSLNNTDPEWRKEFTELFLAIRDKVVTGQEFWYDIWSNVSDRKKAALYLSKIYVLTADTSCGRFFGKDDSPERQLPHVLLQETETILRKYAA